jgi:hypothetical protein
MSKSIPLLIKRSRVAALTASLICFFALCGWALETPSLPVTAADALNRHVRYLSSDELTGRGVDTPGIKLARDYIAREFAKYGLTPAGDNGTYFQSFEVTTGMEIKAPTALAFGDATPLVLNQDWTPLALSQSGEADGEVVFAGYGITAKDYGYDDYAGMDVKGKIVVVLRYEPPPHDQNSPFQKPPRYSAYAALRTKVNNARAHGAAGLILVDLNRTAAADEPLISITSGFSRSRNSIVAVQVKPQLVEKRLQAHGVALTELKEKIDRDGNPSSLSLPALKVSMTVTLEPLRQRTDNVVGLVPGIDTKLKNENIVIGAHYDHLGFGHFGTLAPSSEGQIHHGADDNASGTAALLGIAERMSQPAGKPVRTVIFVAFSGEELGLFGSRYFVDHPPFPLSTTKAMLNLDMVGRLRDKRLTVFGTRSAKELSGIVTEEARRVGLEVRESDGVGRSDHMSFYNKKIPSLHFFTGSHPDYHRPTDTWDKVNAEGMAKVTELVLATAQRIADSNEPLQFATLPSQPPSNNPAETRSYGAYLGSIPDMDDTQEGVRLAGVSDGSPAALAGLREGDIIVEFAGSKVQNLSDLATLLAGKKPGDEVQIIVLRTGEPVTLKVTLRARS